VSDLKVDDQVVILGTGITGTVTGVRSDRTGNLAKVYVDAGAMAYAVPVALVKVVQPAYVERVARYLKTINETGANHLTMNDARVNAVQIAKIIKENGGP
jgi:hypothetical protein